MKSIVLALAGLALAAGSADAKWRPCPWCRQVDPVWMRVDGQRGAGNAALQAQFAADRRYCLLFGTSNAMISCMAGRGYLLLDRPDAEQLSERIRYQHKVDRRPTR
jgi:hypothetical protein